MLLILSWSSQKLACYVCFLDFTKLLLFMNNMTVGTCRNFGIGMFFFLLWWCVGDSFCGIVVTTLNSHFSWRCWYLRLWSTTLAWFRTTRTIAVVSTIVVCYIHNIITSLIPWFVVVCIHWHFVVLVLKMLFDGLITVLQL